MFSLPKNQRGDTIVEVLISLAVLSLVIGSAYSITNLALRNSRQAQERSEATKLAESQIETLKSNPENVPTNGTPFCVAADGSLRGWGQLPPDFTEDDYAVYDAACRNRNNNELYNVFITRNDQLYSVNVRWNRIGGGKEQLQIVYRGYE